MTYRESYLIDGPLIHFDMNFDLSFAHLDELL